jgi:hypothetical protein
MHRQLYIYTLILSLLCSNLGQGVYKHLCKCVEMHAHSFLETLSGQLSGKCCPTTCCGSTCKLPDPAGVVIIKKNCCDTKSGQFATYLNEAPPSWELAKIKTPPLDIWGIDRLIIAPVRIYYPSAPTFYPLQAVFVCNPAHAPPAYNRELLNLVQNYRC